ncbi:MAG: GNAT family N-acetyltransferase [Muribaculum sp.]|nr:GNAT family N-acetyltransferase [Muribaculum sp.]
MFSEYTQLLLAGEGSFKNYLDRQHYAEELEDLQGKYGLPQGRLYLALCGAAPVGCIGLRRMDDAACEMKRLYVRKEYRGLQIGRRLVERILEDARAIGYTHMYLDTFPFLESAVKLYRAYGFYEIPSYNGSPMDSLVYMRRDL